MYETRFTAVLGPDRTIHVPDGVKVEPGPVEVTIVPQPPADGANALRDRMAQAGRELNTGAGLPSDFAENHDHYIHGLPKRTDRP
jgi:hypothetical protein